MCAILLIANTCFFLFLNLIHWLCWQENTANAFLSLHLSVILNCVLWKRINVWHKTCSSAQDGEWCVFGGCVFLNMKFYENLRIPTNLVYMEDEGINEITEISEEVEPIVWKRRDHIYGQGTYEPRIHFSVMVTFQNLFWDFSALSWSIHIGFHLSMIIKIYNNICTTM